MKLHGGHSCVRPATEKTAAPVKVFSWPFQEDLSEPEGWMLYNLRIWTRAQTDPEFREWLNGLDSLQLDVSGYMDGTFNQERSISDNGDDRGTRYFAAVKIIAKLFPLFLHKVDYKYPPVLLDVSDFLAVNATGIDSDSEKVPSPRVSYLYEQKGWGGHSIGESRLIEHMRALIATETSPDAYADWEAWELLRIEVGAVLDGTSDPSEQDIAAQPLLHMATQTIVAWLHSHRASLAKRHGNLMPVRSTGSHACCAECAGKETNHGS